ncbi:MAG: transcriptional regulator [Bacteroidota bacterium]
MNIFPIKTEADYRQALTPMEKIFDAPIDSLEGDEADILSLLIENYEDRHHPIEAPDPIEEIKIRMEEMNVKQKDLIGVIGGKSRVSEVLRRKKKLTVEMIRNLTKVLNLPSETLIQEYQLEG